MFKWMFVALLMVSVTAKADSNLRAEQAVTLAEQIRRGFPDEDYRKKLVSESRYPGLMAQALNEAKAGRDKVIVFTMDEYFCRSFAMTVLCWKSAGDGKIQFRNEKTIFKLVVDPKAKTLAEAVKLKATSEMSWHWPEVLPRAYAQAAEPGTDTLKDQMMTLISQTGDIKQKCLNSSTDKTICETEAAQNLVALGAAQGEINADFEKMNDGLYLLTNEGWKVTAQETKRVMQTYAFEKTLPKVGDYIEYTCGKTPMKVDGLQITHYKSSENVANGFHKIVTKDGRAFLARIVTSALIDPRICDLGIRGAETAEECQAKTAVLKDQSNPQLPCQFIKLLCLEKFRGDIIQVEACTDESCSERVYQMPEVNKAELMDLANSKPKKKSKKPATSLSFPQLQEHLLADAVLMRACGTSESAQRMKRMVENIQMMKIKPAEGSGTAK